MSSSPAGPATEVRRLARTGLICYGSAIQPETGTNLKRYLPDSKLLLITGGLLLYLVILFLAGRQLWQIPRPGVRLNWMVTGEGPVWRGHWLVLAADPGSSLQAGDQITAAGGREFVFTPPARMPFPVETLGDYIWIQASGRLAYELAQTSPRLQVRRQQQILTVTPAIRPDLRSLLGEYEFLNALVGLVYLYIGLVVFHRKGFDGPGPVFYLMCLAVACALLSLAVGTSMESGKVILPSGFLLFMLTVNTLSGCAAGLAMLHFTLLIPHTRPFLLRWKLLPVLPYLLFLAGIGLRQTALLQSLMAVSFLLSLAVIIQGFISSRNPVERQQMKWVAAGFVFGGLPWAILVGIPQVILGIQLTVNVVPMICTACIPLFIAFAILRYRLFDIDALFRGTFVYILTIAILCLVDLGFLAVVDAMAGSRVELGFAGRVLLPLVITVSLYASLRQRVWQLLQHLFRRERRDEAAILQNFTKKASGRTPDEILRILSGIIDEYFQPASLRLIGPADPALPELQLALAGRDGPVRLWEPDSPITPVFTGQEIALPAGPAEQPCCFLLLGELPRRRFYSREDLQILGALGRQARILYDNSLLYAENLQQYQARLLEEQQHQAEKEMILKDLHDGLGGITTSIKMLAEMTGEAAPDGTIRQRLATIAGLAREGLSEIRSFMKSLDGQETDWDSLVADLRYLGSTMIEPHGMTLRFQTGPDQPPGRLHSHLHLNLFRIYKEALTNIIKHAKAKEVLVELAVQDRRLHLTVADDGSGLPPEPLKLRGIAYMRSRAEQSGGRCQVTSPGRGVCVELELPLT